jgi:hypothetical protein
LDAISHQAAGVRKNQKVQDDLDASKITIDEAKTKWKELADEQELASKRMILNMLNQQLAVDGLSTEEMNYLLETGLQWGVYSKEAVNAAKDALREVDALTRGFNNLPTNKTITITANYVSSGSIGDLAAAAGTVKGMKQSGGPVHAGSLYRVNETRTEYFRPNSNGNIIPLGNGGGSGVNVTVNYNTMMSLGNQSDIKKNLVPMIIQGVEEAKAQGRV